MGPLTAAGCGEDIWVVLVGILGPVVVGTALERRDRAALAVLVLHRGRSVGADRLADGIWVEGLPASWRKQVHIVVARLRKVLGPDAIETGTEAYRLTIGPEATDVGAFERLIREGRRHLGDGDPQRVVGDLGRALELWRGTPYAELESWEPARAEIARLVELHDTAEEDLVEALMASGESGDVVARAAALVREEGLREHRWALLARAHYRAGRQGDALAALREAREVLVEALGVDPGAELADLEVAILRQDPSLMTGVTAVAAVSPWPGLRAFGEDDVDVFFGRETDIAECVDRLLGKGLLVVAGASGSGKSSLLRAGIVPELGRRGLSTVVLPASDGGVAGALRHADAGVVALDQFEELFADGAAAADPAALLAAVVGLVEGGGRVIVVVRGDHLGRLAVDTGTGRMVQRGLHFLGPLTGEALRRAILGPAERSGVRCGPGLVEMLVRDAEGEPGALPLLSHALAETWARRSGAVLTVEDYLATGGLRGAVAGTADQFYEALAPERQRIVRSVLLRLVAPTDEGVPVRRRVPVAALLKGGRADVVEGLVAARLLTVEDENVVISHEALMRAWPRLRDWLAEDTGRLQVLRRLESDAAWWDAHGRPDDVLYRGGTLQVATALSTGSDEELEEPDAAFLAASRSAAEKAKREAEQRARALARRNRGLVALLVLAVVVGVLANLGRLQAVRAERRAAIEALVSTSRVARNSDRGLAALLAVQAYREDPGPPTHSALLGMFSAESSFNGEVYLPGPNFAAAAIPGTTTAFVVHARSFDAPASLVVVDLRTGITDSLFGDGSGVFAVANVAVSGDGSVAVVAQYASPCYPSPNCARLAVFDLRTGDAIIRGLVVPFGVSDLALNSDGSLVAAAASEDGRVAWWTTSAGEAHDAPGLLAGDPFESGEGEFPWDTGSVLFAGDGTFVATDRGGSVRAIDTTGAVPDRLAVVPAGFAQTALELDGTTLVMSGHRGIAAVDLTTMAVLWTQPTEEPERCAALALSAYTRLAYCGTPAGVVEVRDLTTGELTGETIATEHGVDGGLAVVDDGRELAAFGNRPVISRWRLDGNGPVTVLVAAGRWLWDGWGSDGGSLLVAEPPVVQEPLDSVIPSFSVWNTASDEELLRLDRIYNLRWAGPGLLTNQDIRGGLAMYDLDGEVITRMQPRSLGDAYYVTEPGVFTTQGAAQGYLWDGRGSVARLGDDGVLAEVPEFRIDADARVLAVSDTESGDRVVVSYQSPGKEWTESVVFSGTTGEELVRADPIEGLTLAAVSPDGTLVGAGPGRITRYDLDTFRPLARFSAAQWETHSLQFNAAGDLLLATAIGQVALYDVATGTPIGDPIATPINPFDDFAERNGFLHPDGDRLAVASLAGVQIWDIAPEHLVEAACRIAGRNLTETEWSNHLDAFGPYEETCPDR